MKQFIKIICIVFLLLLALNVEKIYANHCSIENIIVTAQPDTTPYTTNTDFTIEGTLTCDQASGLFMGAQPEDLEVSGFSQEIKPQNKTFKNSFKLFSLGIWRVTFAEQSEPITNFSLSPNSPVRPDITTYNRMLNLNFEIGESPSVSGSPSNSGGPYKCGTVVPAETPSCPQKHGVSCCPSECVSEPNPNNIEEHYCGDPPLAIITPDPLPPPCGKDGKEGLSKVGECLSLETGIGSIGTEPEEVIEFILGILLSIAGGIAVLLIIYGGYKMMASRGDPEALQNAREIITSAIIGILFLIFSLVILEIIGVDILKIPGFSS